MKDETFHKKIIIRNRVPIDSDEMLEYIIDRHVSKFTFKSLKS